jgi:hypothetical protein
VKGKEKEKEKALHYIKKNVKENSSSTNWGVS